MKKSTLAILVMGLVASQASLAAEIYNKNGNKLDLTGRVKAVHYFTDDTSKRGDNTYARIGFKGETQINDQLTGFGRWEYQISGNKAESEAEAGKTRFAFAGLKYGNYGSFDYGRNYGILYDIAAGTDVLPEFGGDGLVKTDNFMTGRTTGVATYRNNNFFGLVDGLKFGLQYQGKNDRKAPDSNISRANGDGFGTSLSYDLGDSGVSMGIAYASSNRTAAQKDAVLGNGNNKAQAWGTSLKYNQNDIYLAAMYAESRYMTPVSGTVEGTKVSGFATKNQVFEAVAQYQFDFGLRPSLSYVQSKGKELNGIGNADLVKYIDVGATYYFNKNMSAYVDYKINQLKSDNKLGLNSDDTVGVGMVYQF